MKRVGNLWPQVVSFENLHGAAKAAARGKRFRPDVANFLLNLEPELVHLQRELEAGDYQPGTGQPSPAVITLAPTSPPAVASGTNGVDPGKQVEAAKRQGDNYYNNGEYANAINAYQGGLKLAPSNAQLLKALRRAQTAKAAEEKVN